MQKPTTPEQLYIDCDGFFAACEEQADRQLQGRPLGVIPFAGAVHSCVIASNTLAKRAGVTTGMAIADARRRCPSLPRVVRTREDKNNMCVAKQTYMLLSSSCDQSQEGKSQESLKPS